MLKHVIPNHLQNEQYKNSQYPSFSPFPPPFPTQNPQQYTPKQLYNYSPSYLQTPYYTIYIYLFYYQMSNSKRNTYFYSPLKVQSDQKEIIIAHLQQEIYLLRRNEQELIKLQDQYRVLDHRFRQLSEEKIHSDVDFRERHQMALRNICQLKNEIDALRADYREKTLQIGDLQSDENTLIGQLDQRAIEIDKLKNELNSLLADNEELLNERLKLEQGINGVRKDNQYLGVNLREYEVGNDGICRKIEELERYQSQLRSEQDIIKTKILAYQNDNNQLDGDINAVDDDISNLNIQVSNAQNDISALQTDIAEVSALADKFKSQAIHYQRGSQAEIMRNNELTKVLGQRENTHKLRVNQVDEGNKEVSGLQSENQKIAELNSNLSSDIEYCRKHLQNLALLNSDLVVNLQHYSQEDDLVRNLIDRKARVYRARARVQQGSVLLARTTNISYTDGSGRKSRLNY